LWVRALEALILPSSSVDVPRSEGKDFPRV
jgi:hypothetical protein